MVFLEEFLFFLYKKGVLGGVDISPILSFIKEENIGSSEIEMMDKIYGRAKIGFKKYGVNTDRTDLTLEDWVNHTQEEMLDSYIYLNKVKENGKN